MKVTKFTGAIAAVALSVSGVALGPLGAQSSSASSVRISGPATTLASMDTQVQKDINCIKVARVELSSASTRNHSSLARIDGTLKSCQSSNRSWLSTFAVPTPTQIHTDINCVQGVRIKLNRASSGGPGSLAKIGDTLKSCQTIDQLWLTANSGSSPAIATVTTPSTTGVITAGNSKANCIYPEYGTLGYSESEIAAGVNAVTATTGVTYNCVMAFNNGMATWAQWEAPWPENDGFGAWVAAGSNRQFILGMSLIPQAAPGADVGTSTTNPLEWETACAAGNYNSYATTLAQNLIGSGLGNSVIRLGVESNGGWETDYVGSTSAEESAWASCFDQEVTAMRAVSGAHFLFVWNPNSCVSDLSFASWYPGNAYVDIIGLDQYDAYCNSTGEPAYGTAASFAALAAEPDGLNAIAAFAKQEGKPLALPEWGDSVGVDDAAYVQGIASFIAANEFAFEIYFDANDDGVLPLSSSDPLSLAAYKAAFG